MKFLPLSISPLAFVGSTLLLSVLPTAEAQPTAYRIDTIAPAPDDGDGGPASNALLGAGRDLTIASDSTIYFIDGNRIRRVSPSGEIGTFAGARSAGFAGDGAGATEARFASPRGLGLAPDGSLFVADTGNHRIRRISRSGVVTTVAGTGQPGFAGDGGPADRALLNEPFDVAVAGNGGFYITDGRNNRVRYVDPSGSIDTFAGTGTPGSVPEDGSNATEVAVFSPDGIDIGSDGTVYVVLQIRRVMAVTPEGRTRIVLDPERHPFVGFPSYVAVSDDDVVYATDPFDARVHRAMPSAGNTVIAGSAEAPGFSGGPVRGFAGDGGPAAGSLVRSPVGIDISPEGNVVFFDGGNSRIREIAVQDGVVGDIDTTVGRARRLGSRSVVDAELSAPTAIAVSTGGDIYVLSGGVDRIERIIAGPDGAYERIETVAGGVGTDLVDDGAVAVESLLSTPAGIAIGPGDQLFYTEFVEGLIRTVDATGRIQTSVGPGETSDIGVPQPVESAWVPGPLGLDIDADGRTVFATNGDLVRIIEDGLVSILAGGGGQGSEGDGGPASDARLANPPTAKFTPSGEILIPDRSNHKIRKVDASRNIDRIAGNETEGFSGDGGPARNARLSSPTSAIETARGEVIVADRGNRRLRIITTTAAASEAPVRAQAAGTINTLAGDGTGDFTGDGGLSTMAAVGQPYDLVAGPGGTVFFTDTLNDAVRRLTPVSLRFTDAGLTHAASFSGGSVAPAQIVSLFGEGLADTVAVADSVPLPTELSGTSINVTDSAGVTHPCALFFVAPGQMNFEIAPDAARGTATLTVHKGGSDYLSAPIEITATAPGLFSANARGEGVAAAQVLRVSAAGERRIEPLFDSNLAPIPVSLGPEGEQVFLLLFGSGVRGFAQAVTATVGGEAVNVLGAVPQGQFVGLDQINVGPIPRSLATAGVVSIVLTVDGAASNAVTLTIQ